MRCEVDAFLQKFNFDQKKYGMIGIERESFIADKSGTIVPGAVRFLETINDNSWTTFELSACQVETHTSPVHLAFLADQLKCQELTLSKVCKLVGLNQIYIPVGPEDMPLDVYPDPRYERIASELPEDVLRAAVRVAGTHIHIGMPSHEHSLRVYNHVIEHFDKMLTMCTDDNDSRIKLYEKMQKDPRPKPYLSWEDFFKSATERGFDENPRNCWDLIRISKHGTIEFRLFESTSSISKILRWSRYCRKICLEA